MQRQATHASNRGTSRREFLAAGLAAAAAAAGARQAGGQSDKPADRPNILWISIEDTSPWLGFCGEKYAVTPNLDALAKRGVSYTHAFATAPVCSPCRSAIITGRYATSLGTQRLRSRFPIPDGFRGYPHYLRQAGYYCTNNVKTDYNTSAEPRLIRESWDQCSAKAHWRGRKAGQPFFAIFNLTVTHQSQAFERAKPHLPPNERHDPATAPLPPYYPDTPTARATMARVHDCITAMDKQVAQILDQLRQDGLEDDTIVFFWADHGQGIPRGKRTLWDTGLLVPMIVHVPPKYRRLAPGAPGSACDRLVYLMDLAPTVLSLAGLDVPAHMQAQAFLGPKAGAQREYVFGARDRVDEVFEVSRSVRDKRFLYIRNYMPHLSWNQPEDFSDNLGLRREITRLAGEGKLNAAQLTYAGATKPVECLYDTQADPWQIDNLADKDEHQATLERMRKALHEWQVRTRDLGFLPEWQAQKLSEGGQAMCEAAASDEAYPLERILDVADRVGKTGQVAEFSRRLGDADTTVRYWAAIGLRAAGKLAAAAEPALRKALSDPSAPVRIEAAGVLASLSGDKEALDLLAGTIGQSDPHAALHAARTLQLLGEKARPVLAAMQRAKPANEYAQWSLKNTVTALTARHPK